MKKLLLIFAGALLSLTAHAQFTCTLNSQRSYGGSDDEFVPAFAKTADGGYVVACWSASGDKDLTRNKGSYDFWVFKTKSNGDIEWQKNFGGSSRDQSNSILTLKNGGYLVTGHTLSNDSDITKNYGGQDGILMKIDKYGNLTWLKCYGGTGEDELFSAIETDDGKFIACGYTNSNDGMVAGNLGTRMYGSLKQIQMEIYCGSSRMEEARTMWQMLYVNPPRPICFSLPGIHFHPMGTLAP